jgi:predicted transcriptional regulator
MSEKDPIVPHAFRRGARGTIDIVADILRLCKSWRNKTGIMYQANLSHQMLKFYMWHIVELGLLEESDDMKFRITDKGLDFLEYYQRLAAALTHPGSGGDAVKTEGSGHSSQSAGKRATNKVIE